MGEWDVRPAGQPDTTPTPLGNVIRLEDGGCVVTEHWTTPRMTGRSLNIYDRTRDQWHQTWVDSTGGLHEYWGAADADGHLVFRGATPVDGPGNERQTVRLTFFNLGPDRKAPARVRQFSEGTQRRWPMDDQLRSDLHAAPAAVVTPRLAPFADPPHRPPPAAGCDRDALGPALFSTTLVTVGRWRCPPDHPVFADSGPARAHLFVFPRTSVFIQHEGGPRFVADPATVTFYNRGQRYRRVRLSPAGDRGEWYAVAPSVLADLLGRREPSARDRGDRLFAMTHGPSDRRSYLEQRAVFEHVCREHAPDPLFVDETMLGVLDRVTGLATWRNSPIAAPGVGARRDVVERAREVLARRYTEQASLEELARAASCSPFHLARMFRRATGRVAPRLPHRAAAARRAGTAGRRRADLLELALLLGYASHSHFTDVFRSAYGVTPSEVRHRLTRGRARDLARRLSTSPDSNSRR